jgi:hypothetical protein
MKTIDFYERTQKIRENEETKEAKEKLIQFI